LANTCRSYEENKTVLFAVNDCSTPTTQLDKARDEWFALRCSFNNSQLNKNLRPVYSDATQLNSISS